MVGKLVIVVAIFAMAAAQGGYYNRLPNSGAGYGGRLSGFGSGYSYSTPYAYQAPGYYSAAPRPVRLPIAYSVQPSYAPAARVDEYDPNPQYSFAYNVHDTTTGDLKSHHEVRNGDSVRGSYSLVEPGGSRRVVEYTADAQNGFNALVRREPINHPSSPSSSPAAPAYNPGSNYGYAVGGYQGYSTPAPSYSVGRYQGHGY